MEMRIIYIVQGMEKSVGVLKKLQAQIEAFRLLGNKVDVCRVEEAGISIETEEGIRYFEEFHPHWGGRFTLLAYFLRNTEKGRFIRNIPRLTGHTYDMTYNRKYPYNKPYICAIRDLKKTYGTTIVEEIATYPYDSELKHSRYFVTRFMAVTDRYFRRNDRSGIDFYSCVCDEKFIFGVPCIPIMNGYTIVDNPDIHPNRARDNTLHIVTLSTMKHWHGYDRIINGLLLYYKNIGSSQTIRKVILHMIGEGPCLKDWKQLCEVGGISDYVVFHGLLTGNELEQLLSDCDIAVDSMGCHRKGLFTSSALKVREYLAHGLPVVYSSYDVITEGIQEYCLTVPQDESPVDILSVIDFHRSLGSWNRYYSFLRQYAIDHCGWSQQLRKVTERVINQRETSPHVKTQKEACRKP